MALAPPPLSALELSPAQFRSLVAAAVEEIAAHLEALEAMPLDGTLEGPLPSVEFARSLREPLPETGTDYRPLLRDLFARIVPHSYTSISPGFMAYIPGGGILHAAVADLIADSMNRYVGVWRAAPGLAQLELNVVRWLCDIVGYPESALGVLTTGGSLGNLSAIITARRARLGDEEFRDATLYFSDQVHHSVTKAALQAGFPPPSLREVPSDGRFRMRVEALGRAIAQDRAAGRRPFLIVASAGTTNTGAVDDLEALSDLAAREGLWLHVDAAYGGFFLLTERGRELMRGIERADSVVLDPHKGLFLPYGTGAVLVREGALLRRAFGGSADYMPAMQEARDLVDFCEISPELSRDFRGLRLWLPLKMHGVGAFRAQLEEKLDLARWAAEQLLAIEGMEIVAEPQLSIVAFRLRRPGLSEEALTRLNREVLDRVNAAQRVLLTGTMLGERFVLRICVVVFRTHLERVREAVELVRRAVGAL